MIKPDEYLATRPVRDHVLAELREHIDSCIAAAMQLSPRPMSVAIAPLRLDHTSDEMQACIRDYRDAGWGVSWAGPWPVLYIR